MERRKAQTRAPQVVLVGKDMDLASFQSRERNLRAQVAVLGEKMKGWSGRKAASAAILIGLSCSKNK